MPDHADDVLVCPTMAAALLSGRSGASAARGAATGASGATSPGRRGAVPRGRRFVGRGPAPGGALRAARVRRRPLDDRLADAEARLKADQAASVVRAAVVLAQGQAAAEFAKVNIRALLPGCPLTARC